LNLGPLEQAKQQNQTMVTTTTGPATHLLRKLGRATEGWNVIGLTRNEEVVRDMMFMEMDDTNQYTAL
jgi:hypothetical protein